MNELLPVLLLGVVAAAFAAGSIAVSNLVGPRRPNPTKLGILSDRSDDGTTEMIRAQQDCVLLGSTYAFGEWIEMPTGDSVRRRRAGTIMKAVIPRLYLPGSFGIYVDADEFLVLPVGIERLRDVVSLMSDQSADAVVASMIEMYPGRFSELKGFGQTPETLKDLIGIAPFFDGHPLIRLQEGDEGPNVVGESASTRLFRHFAIGARRRMFDPLPLRIRRRLTTAIYSSAVYKTPVVHFRSGVELMGSHDVKGARHSTTLLGLLHFKFTPDSLEKVGRAIAEKSHSRNSHKYVGYRRLFEEMAQRDASFTYKGSVRYIEPKALSENGLTRAG
jgi:hypothetical protein